MTDGVPRPFVTRFAHQWWNRGKRALINGKWWYHPALDETNTEREKTLWDNTLGMTLFVVCRGGARTFSSAKAGVWYAVDDSGVKDVFKWTFWSGATTQEIRFYTTPGTLGTSFIIDQPSLPPTFENSENTIWTLRWLPGSGVNSVAQLFKNGWGASPNFWYGLPTGFPSTPVPPMPSGIIQFSSTPTWFGYFDLGQAAAFSIADALYAGEPSPGRNITQSPLLFAFLAFRRQLTHAEINTVGQHLALTHECTWSDLP